MARIPKPAMVSPAIDTFCVGGASIVFTVGFLCYGAFQPSSWGDSINVGEIVVANILINWPHFLASYRELYRRRSNLKNHPWVAVVLPAALVLLVIYGVATADQNAPEQAGLARQTIIDVLYPFAVFLLAWHYTGQSWGMTATFAHINGVRFNSVERLAIRCGYRVLLVFHLLWVCVHLDMLPLLDFVYPGLALLTLQTYDVWVWIAAASFPIGMAGFLSAKRRHPGHSLFRSWLPWLATYGWYVLVWIYPAMFFVLQIAHALQYLSFPLRVETNRYASSTQTTPRRAFTHTVLYYLCLVAIGAVVFDGVKLSTASADPRAQLSLLISLAINIHHYFTDGVIWKLRRPGVRENLFGHLQPTTDQTPAPVSAR